MDERLIAFAESHHGLFRTTDAAERDVGSREISSLHRARRIERVGEKTYRLPGSPRTSHQELLTAVWTAGQNAVAFRHSAAWLMKVPGFKKPPPRPEVLRLGNRSVKAATGILRQTTYLPNHHRTEVDGIPTVTADRLALELVGILGVEQAKRVLDNLERRRLARTHDFRRILAEAGARGRAGTAMLRALLQERDDGYIPTDSELEDLCLAVMAAAGMPVPQRQVTVGGTTAPIGRIDLVLLLLRIVIECDSKRWHDSWEATLSDQDRDALLRAARWLIVRTNWWQLSYRPRLFLDGLQGTIDIATSAFL